MHVTVFALAFVGLRLRVRGLVLLLLLGSGVARAQPYKPRRLGLLARPSKVTPTEDGAHIRMGGGSPAEVARRREVDPNVVRRLFGTKVTPRAKPGDSLPIDFGLPKAESKPEKPHIMVYPMKVPTGGYGISVKIPI